MGIFDEEEPSFFQKYRVLIVGGFVAACAVTLWFGRRQFEQTSRPRQDQNMIMINLPPAPPPPTPPPPSQLPPPPMENEPKMIAQEPVNAMESKPEKTGPPASESPAVGTSIQGDGPGDGFGLRGGNSRFGGGTGNAYNRGGSSRWGWYASQVQSAISQALQNNHNTRTADFRVDAQIWPDRTGRITHAHLAGSTGNVALDKALTDDVLVGLVLQAPPPDGMPMPIVLRLTARHSQAALSRQSP